MTKYHAQKAEAYGLEFSSKAERDFYCELRLLEKAGEVKSIELQPRFSLSLGFERKGYLDKKTHKVRKIEYVSDFRVRWSDGTENIIDVKGMKTPVYSIKIKLAMSMYPDVTFLEAVRKGGDFVLKSPFEK